MAWNATNKSLSGSSEKALPYGAPVTTNLGVSPGRGYHDSWDIERAYREGMKKVTWVARAVDAIAGNQARLPMIMRSGNSAFGKIINDHETLKVLNSKANPGENSYIFRHRLSAQLLISTRGAFVEQIRGKDGRLLALHLLPPQYTSPIPDPKKFVSGYEVLLPGAGRTVIPASDVLWFRHPHPLNPYLSMTPMEAAGIAIEIENLSKFYNRNFLLNDGRPGGLLVVRSDMDEDDKEELRSRFRGNIARAGGITVLSSEDGVDFVDTASNPRDAAYVEMRRITKEEILAAFGVPESVIGNAANRTFSNAGEEIKVFWMETMIPHLEMLARGFDELDDKHYFDFDTTNVPMLILAKQEREGHLLTEFSSGLITANEYRKATGREEVESDLADTMLANPNLAPIGNTERDMPYVDPAAQAAAVPGQMGMDPNALPGQPGAAAPQSGPYTGQQQGPAAPSITSGDPNAAILAEGAPPPSPEAVSAAQEAGFQVQGMSLPFDGMSTKSDDIRFQIDDEYETKAARDVERWELILDRTLERFFERQQRVIMEKAGGAKAQKAFLEGRLEVSQIFDAAGWNRQIREDIRPVLAGIMLDGAESLSGDQGSSKSVNTLDEQYQQTLDAQTARVEQINTTTQEQIAAAIAEASGQADSDEGSVLLKAAILAVFLKAQSKRRQRIAEIEAKSAYNGGIYIAGVQKGLLSKTWLTEMDDRVRPEHAVLHGKTVSVDRAFSVGDVEIRYPGDPLAPPNLSIGCRCKLRMFT